MMRLSPVKSFARPAYPPRQVVAEHPELLSRLPLRWQRCRMASKAVGLVGTLGITFTLSGCIGANMPDPPFLTEQEAFIQIKSDMVQYGLHPEAGFDAAKSQTPIVYITRNYKDNAYYVADTSDKKPDVFDKQINIGFEYDVWDDNRTYTRTDTKFEYEEGTSVVLVVDSAQYAEHVQTEVTNFLDWLKSEGII